MITSKDFPFMLIQVAFEAKRLTDNLDKIDKHIEKVIRVIRLISTT